MISLYTAFRVSPEIAIVPGKDVRPLGLSHLKAWADDTVYTLRQHFDIFFATSMSAPSGLCGPYTSQAP